MENASHTLLASARHPFSRCWILAAWLCCAVSPAHAYSTFERLVGTSLIATDIEAQPARITPAGRVLQNGTDPVARSPVVVSRGVLGGAAQWAWHGPRSGSARVDWVVPCDNGGVVIGGHRYVESGFFANSGRLLGWVARVDAVGEQRWYVDLIARPVSTSFVLRRVLIRGLWATPDCGAVAYLDPGSADVADRLIALRAADGAIAWSRLPSSLPPFEYAGLPVAVSGAQMVLANFSPGGAIAIALDVATGAESWRQSLPAAGGPFISRLDIGRVSPARVAVVSGSFDSVSAESRVFLLDDMTGSMTIATVPGVARLNRAAIWTGAISLAQSLPDVDRLVQLDADGNLRWQVTEAGSIDGVGGASDSDLVSVVFDRSSGSSETRRHAASSGSIVATSSIPLRYGATALATAEGVPRVAIHNASLSHEVEVLRPSDLQVEDLSPVRVELRHTAPSVVAHGNLVLAASGEASTAGTRIVVTGFERGSGARIWRRSLELDGTSGHTDVTAPAVIVRPDQSVLVVGQSNTNAPGAPGNRFRGVVAQLRVADGAILSRTPLDHAVAYRQLVVSPGGDTYASWRRVSPEGAVVHGVGRLDALAPVWEVTSAVPVSRIAATDDGVIAFFSSADPLTPGRLERLSRADGTSAWSVPRTPVLGGADVLEFEPLHGATLLYRVREPGTARALKAERFDAATGQLLWTRDVDVSGSPIDGLASVLPQSDGGFVINWSVSSVSTAGPYSGALARLASNGSVIWSRRYDLAPAGWTAGNGRPVQLADGSLLVPSEADPDPRSISGMIRIPVLGVVDVDDGELKAIKVMPTRFEMGVDATPFALGAFASGMGEVMLTYLERGPDGLVAPALGRAAITAPVPGQPIVALEVSRGSIASDPVDVLVRASLGGAPSASRAVLRIGLPSGLLASQVVCEADAGAVCGDQRRSGAIVQEVQLSGMAEVRMRIRATIPTSMLVQSPIVAVLEPHEWIQPAGAIARVAVADVPPIVLPDPLFLDSFE